MAQGEREREILRQLGPSVGIWRPLQAWHVAPFTGRLSCRLGGFPICCTLDNVPGLFFSQNACENKRKV